MAIGADSSIEFFGTQDQVTATPGTVADGAFSAAADTNEWTNDDDSPFASFGLLVDYATAPDVGSVINLYVQINDINGTNDSPDPDGNFPQYYLGSFAVDNITTDMYLALADIKLPALEASQTYHFFIENRTGQTIQNTWELWVTPKTYGPHP